MLPQWITVPELPELTILPVPPTAPPRAPRSRRRHRGRYAEHKLCTVPLCDEPWAVLVYARATGGLMAMLCERHGRELEKKEG